MIKRRMGGHVEEKRGGIFLYYHQEGERGGGVPTTTFSRRSAEGVIKKGGGKNEKRLLCSTLEGKRGANYNYQRKICFQREKGNTGNILKREIEGEKRVQG